MANLESVSIKEFYEEQVPLRFASAAGQARGFALQHDVGGDVYTIAVDDGGAVSVRPGAAENPLMAVRISEADWRDVVTGRIDAGALLAEPGQLTPDLVQRMRDTRGTLNLELNRADGDPWRATVIFGDAQSPAVTLKMADADFGAMQRGELNSQMAFITGKLKFEGDLGLLMRLGSLLG
jgi:putative sterol carrier protein